MRGCLAEAMPDSMIPVGVRTLASQLAEPKPMRRGSVSERFVKCNKAGCPCASRSEARHGVTPHSLFNFSVPSLSD